MKIVIFTRTGFHHTSFINSLQDRFEIACVVRESYPAAPREGRLRALIKNALRLSGRLEIEDSLYLDEFHKKFSAGFRYHRMLKDFLKAPFDVVMERTGTRYLNVKCGEINSEDFSSFLKRLGPDIVAVLGSSVISPRVISIPAVGMVNLHSGLSPYYRGTWSYGWPIVNNEPQYIGATAHHVDMGVDTGDIIYQTRPVLDGSDDLNAIFLKVIAEGIELAADAVEALSGKGSAVSYKQPKEAGRLYRTKDFNADVARSCIARIEEGVIGRYNAGKRSADAQVPLLGYVPPRLFR
jgi:methionyl-tRNA formyltransferase